MAIQPTTPQALSGTWSPTQRKWTGGALPPGGGGIDPFPYIIHAFGGWEPGWDPLDPGYEGELGLSIKDPQSYYMQESASVLEGYTGALGGATQQYYGIGGAGFDWSSPGAYSGFEPGYFGPPGGYGSEFTIPEWAHEEPLGTATGGVLGAYKGLWGGYTTPGSEGYISGDYETAGQHVGDYWNSRLTAMQDLFGDTYEQYTDIPLTGMMESPYDYLGEGAADMGGDIGDLQEMYNFYTTMYEGDISGIESQQEGALEAFFGDQVGAEYYGPGLDPETLLTEIGTMEGLGTGQDLLSQVGTLAEGYYTGVLDPTETQLAAYETEAAGAQTAYDLSVSGDFTAMWGDISNYETDEEGNPVFDENGVPVLAPGGEYGGTYSTYQENLSSYELGLEDRRITAEMGLLGGSESALKTYAGGKEGVRQRLAEQGGMRVGSTERAAARVSRGFEHSLSTTRDTFGKTIESSENTYQDQISAATQGYENAYDAIYGAGGSLEGAEENLNNALSNIWGTLSDGTPATQEEAELGLGDGGLYQGLMQQFQTGIDNIFGVDPYFTEGELAGVPRFSDDPGGFFDWVESNPSIFGGSVGAKIQTFKDTYLGLFGEGGTYHQAANDITQLQYDLETKQYELAESGQGLAGIVGDFQTQEEEALGAYTGYEGQLGAETTLQEQFMGLFGPGGTEEIAQATAESYLGGPGHGGAGTLSSEYFQETLTNLANYSTQFEEAGPQEEQWLIGQCLDMEGASGEDCPPGCPPGSSVNEQGMCLAGANVDEEDCVNWQEMAGGYGMCLDDWSYGAVGEEDWLPCAGGTWCPDGMMCVGGVCVPGESGGPADFGASDIRLKKNITKVGISKSGLNIYEFDYIYTDGRYRGVMADEIESTGAVEHDKYGYKMVDYNKIDVNFERIK